jgi:uncharacterized protein YoaH (UPF0181 family)
MFKVLALAALLVATPVLAQTADEVNAQIDTVLGPHETYQTAIETIQKALAEGNIDGIGGYISFGEPIKVNGEDLVIADEADLNEQFETLFNDKVIAAVTGQDYGSLFVNQDGIMFGDGELWLTGVCLDDTCADVFVNISAINNE